jgi:hypothetical protein
MNSILKWIIRVFLIIYEIAQICAIVTIFVYTLIYGYLPYSKSAYRKHIMYDCRLFVQICFWLISIVLILFQLARSCFFFWSMLMGQLFHSCAILMISSLFRMLYVPFYFVLAAYATTSRDAQLESAVYYQMYGLVLLICGPLVYLGYKMGCCESVQLSVTRITYVNGRAVMNERLTNDSCSLSLLCQVFALAVFFAGSIMPLVSVYFTGYFYMLCLDMDGNVSLVHTSLITAAVGLDLILFLLLVAIPALVRHLLGKEKKRTLTLTSSHSAVKASRKRSNRKKCIAKLILGSVSVVFALLGAFAATVAGVLKFARLSSSKLILNEFLGYMSSTSLTTLNRTVLGTKVRGFLGLVSLEPVCTLLLVFGIVTFVIR